MIQRPAERVAAHGLHGGMAVLTCREAGPDADDAGRVRDVRAEILLGQNGVDDDIRAQGGAALRLRIGKNGNSPAARMAAASSGAAQKRAVTSSTVMLP